MVDVSLIRKFFQDLRIAFTCKEYHETSTTMEPFEHPKPLYQEAVVGLISYLAWGIGRVCKGACCNFLSRTFVSCSSETGDIASGVAGHESTKVPTKEGEGAKNRENAKKQTERRDPDEHQPVHGDATTNQT